MSSIHTLERRAMEMGSEGWAVFDGPRMIASNLTEQDAQVLASADALLAVKRAGNKLAFWTSAWLKDGNVPEANLREAVDTWNNALAALPKRLK